MKSSNIGGQAVIEGVMMKNGDKYAVAVRKPDNEIAVKISEYKKLGDRYPILGLPIIRGVVSFGESMVIGIKTLTYSASFFEDEEESAGKEKEKKTEKKTEKSEKKESLAMAGTVALSVILAVGIFMMLPYFISRLLSGVIESGVLLALLEGVIRLVLFLGYVAAISQLKDIKRVFMYHGAEHKSINCIERGDDLTVENVKRHSRLHKRCGTSFLLVVMCVSILFFIVIRVDSAWLRVLLRLLLIPVIAGVSYEFIRFAGRSENPVMNILSRPGMWLQGLTTREPDDEMIETAIASVNAVFDWKPFVEEVREERAAARRRKQEEKNKAEKNKTEKKQADTKQADKTQADIKQADIKQADKTQADKTQADTKQADTKQADTKQADAKQTDIEQEDMSKLDVVFPAAKAAANQNTKKTDAHKDTTNKETSTAKSEAAAAKSEAVEKDTKHITTQVIGQIAEEIGLTSDEEEDDEILKALDKFFVARKKDSND